MVNGNKARLILLGLGVSLLTLSSVFAGAHGRTTSTNAAGGTDDLAPTDVASVEATADQVNFNISISWSLSADDVVRQGAVSGDFTSGGVFTNTNDVSGYNVWRSEQGADFIHVGTVGPGESSFTDVGDEVPTLVGGPSYTYAVTAFDANGNESNPVESEAATLGGPPPLTDPVSGEIILGDFVKGGDSAGVIDFEDFFAFAENFGSNIDDEGFDPVFDVAPPGGDGEVNFDDFFLFASNFGRSGVYPTAP